MRAGERRLLKMVVKEQKETRKMLANMSHESTVITESGYNFMRRKAGMTERRIDKYFRGRQ